MRNLGDHSPNRRIVRSLDDLLELRQAQTADNHLMLIRSRNDAAIPLNLDLVSFRRHDYNSSTVRPRMRATCSGLFIP